MWRPLVGNFYVHTRLIGFEDAPIWGRLRWNIIIDTRRQEFLSHSDKLFDKKKIQFDEKYGILQLLSVFFLYQWNISRE